MKAESEERVSRVRKAREEYMEFLTQRRDFAAELQKEIGRVHLIRDGPVYHCEACGHIGLYRKNEPKAPGNGTAEGSAMNAIPNQKGSMQLGSRDNIEK